MIRAETPGDYERIAEIVEAAFGRGLEARLVEKIRSSEFYIPELSLVAEVNGEVIGHTMFSYATLQREHDSVRIVVMAPVSVDPPWHSKGAGGAMIREGLRLVDERGEPLVHVLGHPTYYPRFGFEPARQYGIEPSDARTPDAVFMMIKLSKYGRAYQGTLVYPAAFDGS